MNIGDLIDMIRVLHNLPSDRQAAKYIGASSQDISNWRRGQRPTAYFCSKIANATDMKLDEVIAIVQLEKEKDPEKREHWNRLLSGAAIVILSVAASMGLLPIDSSMMPYGAVLLSTSNLTIIDIMRIEFILTLGMAWLLYRAYFHYKL